MDQPLFLWDLESIPPRSPTGFAHVRPCSEPSSDTTARQRFRLAVAAAPPAAMCIVSLVRRSRLEPPRQPHMSWFLPQPLSAKHRRTAGKAALERNETRPSLEPSDVRSSSMHEATRLPTSLRSPSPPVGCGKVHGLTAHQGNDLGSGARRIACHSREGGTSMRPEHDRGRTNSQQG